MQSAFSHLRTFSQDLSDLGALGESEATALEKQSQGLMLAPALFCAGMAAAALAAAFLLP